MTRPSIASRPRGLVPLTWAAFALIGWASVLVPALVRQIQGRYAVDDAAIGVYYFVWSAAYAAASFACGFLTERVGRAVVLPALAGLLGLGFLATGFAPTWLSFVVAAIVAGAGAGAIDGGVNGLALAIHDEGRGRALNLLHLFFAIGALTAPVIVGQLVERGVAWEPFFVVTGVAALLLAAAMRLSAMPSGIRGSATPGAAGAGHPSATRDAPSFVLPLVLLAVAILCYVAAEVGVANWIVRFLDDVPVSVATFGLSAFWGGLAVGRLLSARYADRWPHSTFAASASVVAGVAVVAAVAAPTAELAIVGFAVAGFASGPIFPVIVALGGDLYPDRLSATTGILTGAAVVGGTLYPPLVGLLSARFGIAFGLLGAALLSIVCAIAVLGAARSRRSRIADATPSRS